MASSDSHSKDGHGRGWIRFVHTGPHAEQSRIGFRISCDRGCRLLIYDEVKMLFWFLVAVAFGVFTAFLIADLALNRVSVKQGLSGAQVDDDHLYFWACIIAGIFAFLAVLLSLIQIRQHKIHQVHPPSQKHLVRILWMVPIYAVCSWLSMVFLDFSLYIDFIRQCYEAFVIYSFLLLLTKYLGGHAGVVKFLQQKSDQGWPIPCCCCPPHPGNSRLLWLMKYGTLQYVILAPFASIAAVVCDGFNLYDDGTVQIDRGYLYVTLVINTTQFVSLYSLVWFYLVMKDELAPFSPVIKFMCVKAVVFFTFWQSFTLAVFTKAGLIQARGRFSVGEEQEIIQNFLICIEMFLASVVHKYAFAVKDYADGSLPRLMKERVVAAGGVAIKDDSDDEPDRGDGGGGNKGDETTVVTDSLTASLISKQDKDEEAASGSYTGAEAVANPAAIDMSGNSGSGSEHSTLLARGNKIGAGK